MSPTPSHTRTEEQRPRRGLSSSHPGYCLCYVQCHWASSYYSLSTTKFSPGHKLDRCHFPKPFQLYLRFNQHTSNYKCHDFFPWERTTCFTAVAVRAWPVLQSQLAKAEQRVDNSSYPKHQAKRARGHGRRLPPVFYPPLLLPVALRTHSCAFNVCEGLAQTWAFYRMARPPRTLSRKDIQAGFLLWLQD